MSSKQYVCDKQYWKSNLSPFKFMILWSQFNRQRLVFYQQMHNGIIQSAWNKMIIKANEVDNARNIDYKLSELEDIFNVIYLDYFLFPFKSPLATVNICFFIYINFIYIYTLLFTNSLYWKNFCYIEAKHIYLCPMLFTQQFQYFLL